MPLKFVFLPFKGVFEFVLVPASAPTDPATLVDNVLTQEGDNILTQDGSFLLTQG